MDILKTFVVGISVISLFILVMTAFLYFDWLVKGIVAIAFLLIALLVIFVAGFLGRLIWEVLTNDKDE